MKFRLAIAALALALVVVVAVIAFTLVVPDDPSWPPVTTAIIVVTPVVAGGTVSAVLSGSIVRRLVRWSERPLPVAPAIGPEGIDDRALVRAVDDDISEQLSAAVTFLRTIAHSGEVTDEDAREARSLSLELRARLGYALDNVLFYGFVGGARSDLDLAGTNYDMTGVSYGLGAQYLFSNGAFAGLELGRRDVSDTVAGNTVSADIDTVSLRAGFQF